MRRRVSVGRAGLEARLLRLYPRAWRERYGDEVLALVEQSGGGWRKWMGALCVGGSRPLAVKRAALRPLSSSRRRSMLYREGSTAASRLQDQFSEATYGNSLTSRRIVDGPSNDR